MAAIYATLCGYAACPSVASTSPSRGVVAAFDDAAYALLQTRIIWTAGCRVKERRATRCEKGKSLEKQE